MTVAARVWRRKARVGTPKVAAESAGSREDIDVMSPTAPAPDPAGPARTARLRLAGAALLASAVVALSVASLPTERRPSPVRLGLLTAGFGDAGRYDVTAPVTNTEASSRQARVWWLLAVPGAGPEWGRRAYQSSVQSLLLGPGQTRMVRWSESAPVPPGTYLLSAWVHVDDFNGFVHSDRSADIVVRSEGSPLLRHSPPRFGTRITNVDVRASSGSGGKPVLEVGVDNPTAQARRGEVRVGVIPIVTEQVGPAWWRESPALIGAATSIEVAAHTSARVSMEVLAGVPPGRYAVVVLLESAGGELGPPLDEAVMSRSLILPGAERAPER